MFQRFASALFGDDGDDVSRLGGPGRREEDDDGEVEEEDWILVDYLGEDEEDEGDLVMIPSPMATPTIRYASCTSLNSMADTDAEAGPEDDDDEEEEEEEGGFLRLGACPLEESWFVTPPPCFTGQGSKNILLETSPLENLLIEHPSMSVYAHHSPPRLNRNPLPRSLNLELDRNLGLAGPPCSSPGKEKGRRSLDNTRHRPEVADSQRRPSLHTACYAAALSARASLLQPQQSGGRRAQRAQPLSRNAMRRVNLLCHPATSKQGRANAMYLHQPNQRHLNY
ncbi:Tumor protein p53-inducible nuclear protein 1 [Merluccius polli]|uniref:Tumor protein p53-inducible nuclear protein 1 n=1 Tax=Merluccius polli TaxID=89951 RepID=A0AA47NWB5_MERPO|nr:Tumor protein p53-inducible nuclear protein 1 [Merluccius polli]